jgi:hypothetical protein
MLMLFNHIQYWKTSCWCVMLKKKMLKWWTKMLLWKGGFTDKSSFNLPYLAFERSPLEYEYENSVLCIYGAKLVIQLNLLRIFFYIPFLASVPSFFQFQTLISCDRRTIECSSSKNNLFSLTHSLSRSRTLSKWWNERQSMNERKLFIYFHCN